MRKKNSFDSSQEKIIYIYTGDKAHKWEKNSFDLSQEKMIWHESECFESKMKNQDKLFLWIQIKLFMIRVIGVDVNKQLMHTLLYQVYAPLHVAYFLYYNFFNFICYSYIKFK